MTVEKLKSQLGSAEVPIKALNRYFKKLKLVRIRYCDHFSFRDSPPERLNEVKPAVVDAVGYLYKNEGEYLVLISEGHEFFGMVNFDGQVIMRANIIELEEINEKSRR